MGLFDKFFGTPKEVNEEDRKMKIRAQCKDEKYFNNEINRFKKIIEDTKTINQSN